MMASWQKMAISEIQANLGVKLEDPYKTPHRSDKVEVSKEYAMQWAIRRVQEASCITQTNRDSHQRERWGEGICVNMQSYQKQDLIHAEWQGCKSIRAHMECPNEGTREQLQKDKESLETKHLILRGAPGLKPDTKKGTLPSKPLWRKVPLLPFACSGNRNLFTRPK